MEPHPWWPLLADPVPPVVDEPEDEPDDPLELELEELELPELEDPVVPVELVEEEALVPAEEEELVLPELEVPVLEDPVVPVELAEEDAPELGSLPVAGPAPVKLLAAPPPPLAHAARSRGKSKDEYLSERCEIAEASIPCSLFSL